MRYGKQSTTKYPTPQGWQQNRWSSQMPKKAFVYPRHWKRWTHKGSDYRSDNETPITDLISDGQNLIVLKVYTDLNLNI